MYCNKCGEKTYEKANFCHFCGSNLNSENNSTNDGYEENKLVLFTKQLAENVEIDEDSFRYASLKFDTLNVKMENYYEDVTIYCAMTNLALRQKRCVNIIINIYDKNNKIISRKEEYLFEDDFFTKTITCDCYFTYSEITNAKSIKIYAKTSN